MPNKKIIEDEKSKNKKLNTKSSSVEKEKVKKGKVKEEKSVSDGKKTVKKDNAKKDLKDKEKKSDKVVKEKATKTSKIKKEKEATKTTKSLPKAEKKKELPVVKEKKKLPKVEEKKSLPKAEDKKKLPSSKKKELLPKKEKVKTLPENELTKEEKDKELLEKIKAFFKSNPDQAKDLDKIVDKEQQDEFLPEYYDLPYRYNETVVKILAQTPKRLFIYWDVADKDIEKYKKAFGEDFFEKTYPVLLVHNEEKNYTYEIPINDFANSWYLDINDPKCKYVVKLGRKFKEIPNLSAENRDVVRNENIDFRRDYIEIVSSNSLEAPNDHVLFDSIGTSVKYRNVKTYEESTKEITTILGNMAKVYNVFDLYNLIYQDEMKAEMFSLNNPGSAGNPSSSITSSMFK